MCALCTHIIAICMKRKHDDSINGKELLSADPHPKSVYSPGIMSLQVCLCTPQQTDWEQDIRKWSDCVDVEHIESVGHVSQSETRGQLLTGTTSDRLSSRQCRSVARESSVSSGESGKLN